MPGFFKLQLFWLAVSMTIPGICMALVLSEAADPFLLSNIALPSVLGSWIMALLMPLLFAGNSSPQQRMTGFVLMWSCIAIVFPLGWDLPWAIFHDWVNGATAEDKWKWYFWAYAVADTRFLNSDPLMIIVEYWSGIIGIIEILFLRAFLNNRLQQAIRLFVIAGCLQFYGCTVFFVSELMNNLQNIRPDAVSYIKFFGMNGMWMVVPAISGYLLMQLLKQPGYDSQTCINGLMGKA